MGQVTWSGQVRFTAQAPMDQRPYVTWWRSISGGGGQCVVDLAEVGGDGETTVRKDSLGSQGPGTVLCPPGPWVTLPAGPLSPFPHVPPALAAPPPILSSVRGVVSPRTDYCQDWHVKTSSLVSSTCIGIVAVTRVAPGGPEGDCNLPRATQEVAEPGGTSCCLFLLSFSPNI